MRESAALVSAAATGRDDRENHEREPLGWIRDEPTVTVASGKVTFR